MIAGFNDVILWHKNCGDSCCALIVWCEIITACGCAQIGEIITKIGCKLRSQIREKFSVRRVAFIHIYHACIGWDEKKYVFVSAVTGCYFEAGLRCLRVIFCDCYRVSLCGILVCGEIGIDGLSFFAAWRW